MANLGSKQFWKTIKYLKKTSSQVPTLKNGATEASTNTDKASLLNDIFSKNFNDALPPLSELDQWVGPSMLLADPSSPPPEDILCTEQEIFNLCIALDTSKSLRTWWNFWENAQRNCHIYCTSPNRAFQYVTHMWENSFKWKLSSVVPIPKLSGNADNPSNYMPLSLLSVVSKIMERHIYSIVFEHLQLADQEFLSAAQWGFNFALGNPQLQLSCQLFTTSSNSWKMALMSP